MAENKPAKIPRPGLFLFPVFSTLTLNLLTKGVIGKAVRLQSAARTGEILICEATRGKLSQKYKQLFPVSEEIKGKVHEKVPIVAYRHKILEPVPEEYAGPIAPQAA